MLRVGDLYLSKFLGTAFLGTAVLLNKTLVLRNIFLIVHLLPVSKKFFPCAVIQKFNCVVDQISLMESYVLNWRCVTVKGSVFFFSSLPHPHHLISLDFLVFDVVKYIQSRCTMVSALFTRFSLPNLLLINSDVFQDKLNFLKLSFFFIWCIIGFLLIIAYGQHFITFIILQKSELLLRCDFEIFRSIKNPPDCLNRQAGFGVLTDEGKCVGVKYQKQVFTVWWLSISYKGDDFKILNSIIKKIF